MPAARKFDPYDELGVARDATTAEVRSAYRRRAKATHPDTDGGSAQAFAATRRALVILKDPARRERFDRTGDATEEQPDNTRAGALQIIEAFVSRAVDEFLGTQQNDPRGRDLMAELVVLLRKQIAEIEAHVATGREVRKYVEDMISRFEGADPQRPIERGLERRLDQIDGQIADSTQKIACRREAIKIASGYRFRTAPAAAQPPTWWGNVSTTSST